MPESGVNTQLTIERRLASLRRRLVRESTLAIEMLERSLDALQRMDVELAREVRRSDDRVDREEVAIEAECFEILTLFHPFAKDFRRMVRNQMAGVWEAFDVMPISGQTVGIVGYGDIGRAVAARVARGHCARVLDRARPADARARQALA